MKAFFCYEQDFRGKWCPVVYHDEKPRKTENSRNCERSEFHDVPSEFFDSEGNVLFGALVERFAMP